MITSISEYIANCIYDNLDSTTKARYSSNGFDIIALRNRLKVLLIYIFLIPILAVAAYITNSYYEISLSVLFVAMIRIWNGGHHFRPDVCLIVTSAVILGIPLIDYLLSDFMIVMWAVALVLNIFLAPFGIKENKTKLIKKIVSVCFCLIAYFINDMLTISFFVLSFDLINWEKAGERDVA